MLKSKKLPTYNNGIVRIGREKPMQTSFGAKRSAVTADDLEPVVRLCYKRMSMREQDFSFAEQLGFNCSAKVKTRLYAGVETGCKATIGATIYTVRYIDRTDTEMYLYLEGGAPFGNA